MPGEVAVEIGIQRPNVAPGKPLRPVINQFVKRVSRAATRHLTPAENKSVLFAEVFIHPLLPPFQFDNSFARRTANFFEIFTTMDELQVSRDRSHYFVSLGRYFPKIRNRLLLPRLFRHKSSLLRNDVNVVIRHARSKNPVLL